MRVGELHLVVSHGPRMLRGYRGVTRASIRSCRRYGAVRVRRDIVSRSRGHCGRREVVAIGEGGIGYPRCVRRGARGELARSAPTDVHCVLTKHLRLGRGRPASARHSVKRTGATALTVSSGRSYAVRSGGGARTEAARWWPLDSEDVQL